MDVNYKFKLKPFNHQLESLKLGWDRQEFGLFMEMGTGKSKVLIDNMGMLYLEGAINFALVIAPKGVYRNWVSKEIPEHMSTGRDAVSQGSFRRSDYLCNECRIILHAQR